MCGRLTPFHGSLPFVNGAGQSLGGVFSASSGIGVHAGFDRADANTHASHHLGYSAPQTAHVTADPNGGSRMNSIGGVPVKGGEIESTVVGAATGPGSTVKRRVFRRPPSLNVTLAASAPSYDAMPPPAPKPSSSAPAIMQQPHLTDMCP